MTIKRRIIVCGIDPGFDGGISIITETSKGNHKVIYSSVMPIIKEKNRRKLDYHKLIMIFKTYLPTITVIEKTQTMPKQGIASSGRYMYNAGIIHGILLGLNLPFIRVRPQEWKKVMLKGTKKQKIDAIEKVSCLFPDLSLKKSRRSKKPHDGIAESVLIGLYGFTCLNQENLSYHKKKS